MIAAVCLDSRLLAFDLDQHFFLLIANHLIKFEPSLIQGLFDIKPSLDTLGIPYRPGTRTVIPGGPLPDNQPRTIGRPVEVEQRRLLAKANHVPDDRVYPFRDEQGRKYRPFVEGGLIADDEERDIFQPRVYPSSEMSVPAPRRAQEAKPAEGRTPPSVPQTRRGKPSRAYTPAGSEIDTRFAVVEAGELVASNDDAGNINPESPAELLAADLDGDIKNSADIGGRAAA